MVANRFNQADFFRKFKIFNTENLGSVRTLLDEEGNIWFYGIDVAKCLEYKRPNEAVTDCTDWDDRKALKYKAYANSPLAKSLWKPSDFTDIIYIKKLLLIVVGGRILFMKEQQTQYQNTLI